MDSNLPYAVSLDRALKGPGAPSAAAYAEGLKTAEAELAKLLGKNRLELFSDIDKEDDVEFASAIANVLARDASTIFVLGIGGSSLGGQALLDIAQPPAPGRPRVVFLDNPDPVTIERALSSSDLASTRFVAISKSGGTAETLAQILVAAEAIRRVDPKYLKQHFTVITEPKPSALRKYAESLGCPVLDHPLGIGGRYSVLTVVGVLPAILMGLDARALRAGARAVLSYKLPGSHHPAASGAALHWALAREGRLQETVLFCYSDRLKTFGGWFRQLWAESLGKGGMGSTPVAALGPVDQHSQLQLFLDGPGKALFTVMDTISTGQGPVIPSADAQTLGLSYLAGRKLGDLIDAETRATIDTLSARHPVRHIHVPILDEKALGALFMHFMLETILMGRLMGVDPFDQPAVEEGKVLARKYLDAMQR